MMTTMRTLDRRRTCKMRLCMQEGDVSLNVELLAFLNKNDYKGFKNKLVLLTDLEENDDLDIMTKLMDPPL